MMGAGQDERRRQMKDTKGARAFLAAAAFITVLLAALFCASAFSHAAPPPEKSKLDFQDKAQLEKYNRKVLSFSKEYRTWTLEEKKFVRSLSENSSDGEFSRALKIFASKKKALAMDLSNVSRIRTSSSYVASINKNLASFLLRLIRNYSEIIGYLEKRDMTRYRACLSGHDALLNEFAKFSKSYSEACISNDIWPPAIAQENIWNSGSPAGKP
jgi:hypothetical protein